MAKPRVTVSVTKRKRVPVEGSPAEERSESKAERRAENKAGMAFKNKLKRK